MPRDLPLEPYLRQRERWPSGGRPLLCHHDGDSLVVYQAFNEPIARWVVEHGRLGGPGFGFHRASWVKPSFLWMMYRSGWCTKPNQERALALWVRRERFEALLEASELSHFVPAIHGSEEVWRRRVSQTVVRVQWDPDRSPAGGPLERRAIQVGLMGEALRSFAEDGILAVQDVTHLAEAGRARLAASEDVLIPVHSVMSLRSEAARRAVGLSSGPKEQLKEGTDGE